uniref:Uncharacterized protein n=1 Tax=Anguilla anguilla TaxID=7936 RepID=A0A0E9PWS9_ANGAN
MESCTLVI